MFKSIRRALVLSAVAALALITLPGAVQAQYVVAEGIAAGGYSWSRNWVDINGDGRDDFCEVAGGSGEQLRCYLSNGANFGPAALTFSVPAGTASYSVRWMDINGDGMADLCRAYGDVNQGGAGLNCRLAPDFATGPAVALTGLSGWDELFVADVNGDGRTDVCHLTWISGSAGRL